VNSGSDSSAPSPVITVDLLSVRNLWPIHNLLFSEYVVVFIHRRAVNVFMHRTPIRLAIIYLGLFHLCTLYPIKPD